MKKAVWARCAAALCFAVAAMGLNVPAMAQDAPAGDLEAIKLELPQPAFGGTPLNYFGKNLEPTSFKERPPFMAPKGTTNVAKGKPVTASSDAVMGKLEQITDGEKETVDKNIVELKPDKQWVQIDLGAEHNIYAILVWHFFQYDRVYFDIVVQISNDPEFTKDVTTVFNNDHDNTSGLGVGKDKEYIESNKGKLIDAKGTKGRYVRLYSNKNTTDSANQYIEVEVYGLPAN